MQIALAQTALRPDSLEEALAALDDTLSTATGSDLVLFPELYLCGYGDARHTRELAVSAEELERHLAPRAAVSGVAICMGFAERTPEGLYNAALLVGPDGQRAALYRKMHLWGDYERTLFLPGGAPGLASLGGLRVGVLICYDLDMPAAAQHLARQGADFLLVLSATGAEYDIVPSVLVPARAYENALHVAFCNQAGGPADEFCGGSLLAAPDGQVIARAPDPRAAETLVIGKVDVAAFADWRARHRYFTDQRDDLLVPLHDRSSTP